MNKKKLTVAILAIGLPGLSTLLLSDNAHALGNPSYTFIYSTTSNYDVANDNTSPYTWRVAYTYASNMGANVGLNSVQMAVYALNLASGHTYDDGVNIQCSQSGFHNTNWLGPYTQTTPTGDTAIYCSFSNPNDVASQAVAAAKQN